MRIQSIHIENFGKLHDFELELESGLNVIRAENGWGKSTLAAFVKAMLYGLEYTTKRSLKENERKKYTPWQGGAFGGSMEFEADQKRYRAERFFGAKEKEDTFRLLDLATGLESDRYSERLGEELFHLDRAAFERSSFFAQQDFAAGQSDSLNARLSRVEEDAGDMRNYENAVVSLEEQMKFYQKTGNRGQIAHLEQNRREALDALSECRNRENALDGWREKLTERQAEADVLLEKSRCLEDEIGRAQEQAAKRERAERYEALRGQAEQKEEARRRAAEALADPEGEPMTEAELDRRHEQIFRWKELRMREQEARERVSVEKRDLEELRAGQEAASGSVSIPILFVVAAALLAGAGLWYLGYPYRMAAIPLWILGAAVGVVWLRSVQQKKRQAAQELAAASRQAADAEGEYRTRKEQRRALEAELCTAFGISQGVSEEELENCWRRERQKNRDYERLRQDYAMREREARRCREEFLAYAGKFPESELKELREKKEQQESDAMPSPVELKRRLDDCRAKREQLLQELSGIRNRMDVLAEAAERIPELEDEIQRLEQELQDAEREHGLLEKTIKYLKTAKEQFSTRYLKELQQGLENYVAMMEPDRPVRPELDVKLRVKLVEGGASRDLDYFSAGWQDLIQIAERFAIVDALYEEESPVLILDDAFANLDTAKQRRAMALLEKMAEKWQMIYFTCQEQIENT